MGETGMRAWQVAVATAAAFLAVQAPARADIELVNQTAVPIYFEISTYAEPGEMAMAVMCGTITVAKESATFLAQPAVCTAKATIRATAPRPPTGAPRECRLEGLAWSGARIVVSGSVTALSCAQ